MSPTSAGTWAIDTTSFAANALPEGSWTCLGYRLKRERLEALPQVHDARKFVRSCALLLIGQRRGIPEAVDRQHTAALGPIEPWSPPPMPTSSCCARERTAPLHALVHTDILLAPWHSARLDGQDAQQQDERAAPGA